MTFLAALALLIAPAVQTLAPVAEPAPAAVTTSETEMASADTAKCYLILDILICL